MITRPTGADLLPFDSTYRGVRFPPRAVWNAEARQKREVPPPDEAYTAERLRGDLAALQDPRNRTPGHEDLRGDLARRGWTDERLAAARRELVRRVRLPRARSRRREEPDVGGWPTRSRLGLPPPLNASATCEASG